MLSVELFLSSSSSEDEENYALIRKQIRDTSNPLELPNPMLNKDTFRYLLEVMSVHFHERKRTTSIPPYLKIAAALRFFAEGGYQKGVEQDFNIGMSQSTISYILKEVLDIFENVLCPMWISFKLNEQEKHNSKTYFFEKYGFPGVIGCVDGTHIKIIRPSQSEHLFFNRKGFHSINAMLVCDYKMAIRTVDARYGGASHDSHVWELSEVKRTLSTAWTLRDKSWLLGDSGYPLEPWIMTPFRATGEGTREARYNNVHSKCRSIIERTIGMLKSRFRCLLSARELHYPPKQVVKIINACCVLHNICIAYKVEECQDTHHEEFSGDSVSNEDRGNDEGNDEGRRIRNEILNSIC